MNAESRKQFEQFLSRRGTPLDRDGDSYRHQYAADCWEAWCAAMRTRPRLSPNREVVDLALAVVENCEALAPGCADEGIGGESVHTLKSKLYELANS